MRPLEGPHIIVLDEYRESTNHSLERQKQIRGFFGDLDSHPRRPVCRLPTRLFGWPRFIGWRINKLVLRRRCNGGCDSTVCASEFTLIFRSGSEYGTLLLQLSWRCRRGLLAVCLGRWRRGPLSRATHGGWKERTSIPSMYRCHNHQIDAWSHSSLASRLVAGDHFDPANRASNSQKRASRRCMGGSV